MASNNSSFRATQWDPVLILSQIVCLQSLWYFSISTIVYTLFRFAGAELSLDAILNYHEIRADNAQGMLLGFAWLLNSVVGVYLLLKIVARARLVLDFSLTLLLYHILMVTYYSGHVPSNFLWWALNGTTAGVMIFGGEYVCMQLEMEPIILGNGSSSGNNNASTATGANSTSNISSSTNNHNMSSQGASLASSDGHAFEESTGLLMEEFNSSSNDQPNNASSSGGPPTRSMPHKARSSEDAGNVMRSAFSPAIRSGFMGNQNHGRQRTSDRYETVPTSDADHR
ncbi:hypothetical protein BGZ52_000660 [Haplosporangium bisporale]|nr:hypothetical protein BGZ52_000660 [Haplosporangium bisporale]KAF9215728.1 hypothetical protein BGZ59_000476 [Podila verticillata]KFH67413.1 hypothetical protein MVEG_06146 [Podila verticillata NRRL 6337]